MARGLLGLVTYKGRWMKPAEVQKQTESDPAYQNLIHEYTDRRARTADKADAQMKLAAWCTEKGLTEQAAAHYHAAVRLDPSRELAWRHLGYKKHGNRWIKPEEAAAEKAEADRQKHADQHWKSRLEKLHEGLQSSHAARREKAEQGLAEVTDPRAVPMVWRLFATGGERSQLAAAVSVGPHRRSQDGMHWRRWRYSALRGREAAGSPPLTARDPATSGADWPTCSAGHSSTR